MNDVEKMIINRLDRIEEKVDSVISFKYKAVGGLIMLSCLTSLVSVVLLR